MRQPRHTEHFQQHVLFVGSHRDFSDIARYLTPAAADLLDFLCEFCFKFFDIFFEILNRVQRFFYICFGLRCHAAFG